MTITPMSTARSALRSSRSGGTRPTLTWLPVVEERAGEEEEEEDEGAESDEHYDRPIDKFHRSAAGSVSMAWMLGLRDALEGRPEKEETEISTEAPAQPQSGNIDLVLDPEHPERSVVIVRRPREDNQ